MTKQPNDDDPVTYRHHRALAGKLSTMAAEQIRDRGEIERLDRNVKVLLTAKQKTPSGQPDWMRCRKSDTARTLLVGTHTWMEDVGRFVGLPHTDVPECWPWHTTAVVLLLAASRHYTAVYRGDSAAAVTDYLVRTVTAVRGVVKAHTGNGQGCSRHEHHIGTGNPVRYTYTPDAPSLEALADWWATSDRTGTPPGLAPILASTG